MSVASRDGRSPRVTLEGIRASIRDIPDFPKPGIVFKDITPLLAHPALFRGAVDRMAAAYKGRGIRKVIGIESRGFLLATTIAYKLGAGVVPVRKKGKLPHRVVSWTYKLEYGEDTLEMHDDALKPGEKVLVVDDVLATGGTAEATCGLAKKLDAQIAGFSFLIELSFLNGRERLKPYDIYSLLKY